MDVKSKEIEYQIKLEAEETIEITINDNSAFKETVPEGYICNVYFKYQEKKL